MLLSKCSLHKNLDHPSEGWQRKKGHSYHKWLIFLKCRFSGLFVAFIKPSLLLVSAEFFLYISTIVQVFKCISLTSFCFYAVKSEWIPANETFIAVFLRVCNLVSCMLESCLFSFLFIFSFILFFIWDLVPMVRDFFFKSDSLLSPNPSKM